MTIIKNKTTAILLEKETSKNSYNENLETDSKPELTAEYIQAQTEDFAIIEGRRPRIMIADIENTNSKDVTKQLATVLADLGFDIDIEAVNRTPETIAQDAIDNDVHLICLRSNPFNYAKIIAKLKNELIKFNAEDLLIAVGSDIGPEETKELKELGVCKIFRNEQYLKFASDILKTLEAYYMD